MVRLILNVFALILFASRAHQLPPNPCPHVFRYETSASGEIHGIVTLKNDLSGNYKLDLKMILPIQAHSSQNIAIESVSSLHDAQSGKDIVFYVSFPRYDVIPEVDQIVFNGRLHCTMSHTLGSQFQALTFLSASSVFSVGDIPPGQHQHQIKEVVHKLEPESGTHFFNFGSPGVAVHKLQTSDQGSFLVDSRVDGPSQRQPEHQIQQVVHKAEPGSGTHFFNFGNRGEAVHKLQTSDPESFLVNSHVHGTSQRQPEHQIQEVVHKSEPGSGTHFFNFGNRGEAAHELKMSDPEPIFVDSYPTKEIIKPPELETHILKPVDSLTTSSPESFVTNVIHPLPTVSTTKAPENVECGIADDSQPLVVRGKATSEGQYPWLVAMFHLQKDAMYKFRCGGNLVTNNHVLTAAHCVRRRHKQETLSHEEVTLVLGKHNINTWATRSEIRAVKEIHVHPDYRQPSDADIAILAMDKPVEYTSKIRPVCLWGDGSASITGREGTVVGWGRDEFFNEYVPEPREIKMPVVSQEDCLRSDERFLPLTSRRTFCAGTRNGTGACTGDSGGGFVIRQNGRWTLRGIVSSALQDFNTKSCDLNNYMIFSDVGSFKQWIENVLVS